MGLPGMQQGEQLVKSAEASRGIRSISPDLVRLWSLGFKVQGLEKDSGVKAWRRDGRVFWLMLASPGLQKAPIASFSGFPWLTSGLRWSTGLVEPSLTDSLQGSCLCVHQARLGTLTGLTLASD